MSTQVPLYRFRRATASVELAVCLPVIVLLVFASLEGANMLFLRQAVVQSAYETAKAAAKAHGQQATAETLGRQVLSSRGVSTPTISFTPANVQALAPGSTFSVAVSVPGNARSIIGFGPFNGLIVRAQATMLKE
jgi:Flp pilus assembly protein TadG